MILKRLWHTFRIATQRNGYKRAVYIRDHNLFHHVGSNIKDALILAIMFL